MLQMPFISERSRTRKIALAGGSCALLAAAVLGVGSATGAAKVTVIGASAQTAAPSCPSSPCQAIGKVTGFQTAIGNQKMPFVAPYDGKVIAWSIKTSAPSESQTKFFDDFYGGGPKARLSILKPLKKNPIGFKLRAQGPIEDLAGMLGSTTTFALKTPLNIRKGQMIGLTVPTWAPVFAVGLPKGNAWRASRAAGSCEDTAKIKAGSGHEQLGSERTYGCSYTTARLLYSATFVRGPQTSKKKPPKKGDDEAKPPADGNKPANKPATP